MMQMSITDAMLDGCRAVGIEPPRKTIPGRWVQCPVTGKARTNTSGRVMLFDDGKGGICWNWATGEQHTFRVGGESGGRISAPSRDPEKERRQREEQAMIAHVCAEIVSDCQQSPHPYLERKGFPDELALVHVAPWRHFPGGNLGEAMGKALPEGEGPYLIVPGRIAGKITTIQFITPEGAKKNILRGIMGGASHRIATGRETWVCEGIATALSVRAALRLLGRSATVLSAFSAANVAKVASGLGGIIAADHDKPVPTLGNLGAGEFYAVRSGCVWVQPAEQEDFNDLHQREGVRAVALRLREVVPP